MDKSGYVGIDLHRRRSLVVHMSPEGDKRSMVQLHNERQALAEEITKAGPCPEVVMEATYGWYWVADVLAEQGAHLHLAHPLMGIDHFVC
jgi:hypothetical protein